MEKPKKTLVAIIVVAALAAVGYYFASNGFNFPAEEAEGSGIGGVKRAVMDNAIGDHATFNRQT